MGPLIRANLKHHARRYTATVVAAAIAVAFVAAALVFGGALNQGIRDQVAGQYTGAAVVVSPDYESAEWPDLSEAVGIVEDVPGVTEVYAASYSGIELDRPNNPWLSAATIGGQRLHTQTLESGTNPTTTTEILVSDGVAQRYELEVGSVLTAKNREGNPLDLTVTGIVQTKQQSIMVSVADVFFTNEGLAAASPGLQPEELLAAGDKAELSSEEQEDLATAVQAALDEGGIEGAVVTTGHDATEESLKAINTSSAALTLMLLLFPVIAATVAMIVIGTTFQVIFRQRERELALLRVIGATGKQVRRLMVMESVAVGLVGSVIGIVVGVLGGSAIASAGGVVSSFAVALTSVSITQVLVLLVIGTLLTTLAGFRPALRASRVAPVQALAGRPESVAQMTRKQVVTGLVSGVLTAGLGGATAYLAFSTTDPDLKMERFPAVLGLAVLTAAALITLLSAVLPLITRAVGKWGASESYRLAAVNTVRNPGRTAATGIAVFIGVTLISMVTFGAESLRATSAAALDRSAPIDLVVSAPPAGFTDKQLSDLEASPGLATSVVVDGAPARIEVSEGSEVFGPEGTLVVDSGLDSVMRGSAEALSDGEVLVPAWLVTAATEGSVCVEDTCADVTLIPSEGTAGDDRFVVTPATATNMGVELAPTQVWMQLEDPGQYADIISQIQESGSDLQIEGAVALRSAIDQIVNILVMVVVGLLAVSVLVALVGITNTLSLSVAERSRENGLLRALGMTRKQVRSMLSWEALLIAVTSTLLGLLAGAYFGAVGFMSLPTGVSESVLAVPWVQWLIIVVVAIGAALVASIVPGRRASRVSPVEALAAE